MGTTERRHKIMMLLCKRRHETVSNLATEFGVSERTIRRDIDILSFTYPIYTQQGRYAGGIYVMNGYYIDQLYLTTAEINFLKKILLCIKKENENSIPLADIKYLDNLIIKYTLPTIDREGENND